MFPMDESHVDVLIVGAGPSGLMLSTWMARMGIKTRIVDRRFDRVNSGQADGLQSRTFEILDSLGIGQDIWREANHMLEIRFWNPNAHNQLYRSDKIVDTKPGISRFQQATLHQARIEDYLLSYVRKHSNIEVEYGIMPESLSIDVDNVEKDDAYPVSVNLRHLVREVSPSTTPDTANKETDGVPNGLFRSNLAADVTDSMLNNAQNNDDSHVERIHAKYVVGCDGAHSWTRRQIGSVMEGEQSDYIWGVLDIIPITDFPDIRYRCAIHSAAGSMMIIPREDKLVRLYIQVTETDSEGNPVDRFKVTPQTLLDAASRILSPYKLSYQHCHWWTAYRIGQRVGSKFSAHDRVFLAGDAVHTHSPKAGQGMNISMHDTFNLGWKLAAVINGNADRSLLATYTSERRQIAQELIEFDHKFSRLFSGRPSRDDLDEAGIDLKTFKQVFDQGNLFACGCAVDYTSNLTIAKHQPQASKLLKTVSHAQAENPAHEPHLLSAKQQLATGIPIGQRIPSHKVVNQSDARPWHLQELLPSNGAWRILVFPGDISNSTQYARYKQLGEVLEKPESFLHRYGGGNGQGNHPTFEVLTIHAAPRSIIELQSLPEIFHPFSDEYGWDYSKVYVDEESYHEGHGRAYENYGIEKHRGCCVVVRPDQYVSWIGDLEDVNTMDQFFSAFMRTPVRVTA